MKTSKMAFEISLDAVVVVVADDTVRRCIFRLQTESYTVSVHQCCMGAGACNAYVRSLSHGLIGLTISFSLTREQALWRKRSIS